MIFGARKLANTRVIVASVNQIQTLKNRAEAEWKNVQKEIGENRNKKGKKESNVFETKSK